MRLIKATFKGLKGIYMKSGIKEITIDFNKCKHRIIYIIGKNGSGKSTLMSALHPLPDSASMYLDRELGYKELIYDCNGIMYKITIQYPVYGNGSRATTKAFFTQIDDTGEVELNSNGTVGSFKDIVYTKFVLDPNFISLSHLSVEDRGLVERKPSERKKFVVSLLESVEVYNDINKTLIKRSSVFKSFINSITAKMDSIGDESKLIGEKAAADQRYAILVEQKSDMEKQIASSKATISLIDPDGAIRDKYTVLLEKYNQIKSNILLIESSLPDTDILDLEEASSRYLKISQSIHAVQLEIDSIEESIQNTLLLREEDAKVIFIKNQKYQSISEGVDILSLKKTIAEYKKKIFEYEEIFKKIGIKKGSISKDEYITVLNLLESIRSTIVNIKGYATSKAVSYVCDCILASINLSVELQKSVDKLTDIDNRISSVKADMNYYSGLLDRVTILANRPKECTISECSFIKDALEAGAQNPYKKAEELQKVYSKLIEDQKKQEDETDFYRLCIRVFNDLSSIFRLIDSNKTMIAKLPIGESFIDKSIFVERVKMNDPFNDIQDIYSYINYANIFELYENDNEILRDLESSYKVAKAQESVILDLQDEINDLTKKIDKLDEVISDKQKQKADKCKRKLELESELEKVDTVISILRKLNELKNSKSELESQLSLVTGNIEKISNETETINKCEGILNGIINEMAPLAKLIEGFTFSLNKLAEYRVELQQYQDKYNLIELLKKYSSPTKGGIQTIFMQLYMDKTLNLANQLLGMLFGGDIELLPYVINENEFRIPVKSNITNLVTDDVCNCSTSEKSMIAMIMSFALAFHSSQTYNIVRLDEVDGGLDQSNRAVFPVILDSIIQMLNIEQCFIISHSSESDMSDVDVISLTPVSHETMKGNVIFQL